LTVHELHWPEVRAILSSRLLPRLDSEDGAHALLAPLGFSDWRAAGRLLRGLAGFPPDEAALARLLPGLLRALADAANPERALINLDRLIQAVPDRRGVLEILCTDPHALELLVKIFAGSQFLTDISSGDPNTTPA
jgi:[glutamine synthetase] adenylyltransferase / [glutamine synthetase]-adenylyl-L-tyrosine phosphorylase